MTTIKNLYVHDLGYDVMYPITGNATLSEIVKTYVGVPAKNEVFNLVEETRTGFMASVITGDSLVLRSNNKTLEIKESYKWTGKDWQKI